MEAATVAAPAETRKPNGRQMFRILYRMLDLAGREAPTTFAEASALIDQLEAALEAKRAAASGSDIPL